MGYEREKKKREIKREKENARVRGNEREDLRR